MVSIGYPLAVTAVGLLLHYASDKAKQPGIIMFAVGLFHVVARLSDRSFHW